MPTLDPIQPQPSKRTPRPVRPVQPNRPQKKKPATDTALHVHGKRTMWMWLSIGATMAIILAVWLAAATGPNSVLRKSGSDDLLHKLNQSLKTLFGGSKSSVNASDAATNAHLQDLRERVFPQFSNINEAAPAPESTNSSTGSQ